MALFSRAPVAHLPFRLALSPPTRSRGDCRTSAVSRDAPPTVTGGNVRVANGRIGVGPEERKGARNGRAGSRGAGAEAEEESGELPVLYDDGYGTASVKDFLDRAKEIARPDGGPPRWFCPVECGKPIQGAPLLLFLPGIDGTGMGLILHHRPLGKAFEVRCLHIPVSDRTQFEGLVEFVEHTVQNEFASSPNKAIYLVGDSFGGCLALAVAARNPTIDFVLILCNPATSFNKSQLQPLFPVLKVIPNELHVTVPYLLSFVLGDPIKLAIASIDDGISPSETLDQLSKSLTSLLPRLSDLADIIPKESLLWKLKLLNSAASYANSRLHAVKADVLVLYSGKDNMLPSEGEGKRLWTSLKNCRVRKFKDNGHALLLEGGINLMTIIKATNLYRRSRKLDYITDSLPPSLSEFRETFEKNERWFRQTTSPVILSTLRNGEIVRGLSGVPDKGPVLFVGNHMLMGLELAPLYEEFVKEKRINIHGMTHPILFSRRNESSQQELSRFDLMKVFGALPVSPLNMYKLLSRKSFVLLYPGGAREALHRKGEEYKLFWPDQPEFVRMAAQFEATIVPFGVVGEDDISELVLDYNDQTKIPYLKQRIMEFNQNLERLRTDADGEVSEQDIHFPICLPKIPGRFYYLFGKPIETKGLKESIKDRKNANQLYLQTKSNVENILQYLKKKREEDPYRDLLSRAVYQASWGSTDDAPSFDP